MQVDQMKREREEKNKIIANLMTQIKVYLLVLPFSLPEELY
jgi:hypothetical protein